MDDIRPFGRADAHLCAVEVSVVRSHVAEEVIVPGSDHHIDPETWHPLIMKFCQYYGDGANLAPSSLVRGWTMPPLGQGAAA